MIWNRKYSQALHTGNVDDKSLLTSVWEPGQNTVVSPQICYLCVAVLTGNEEFSQIAFVPTFVYNLLPLTSIRNERDIIL